MTRSNYFFYPKSTEEEQKPHGHEEGRALPTERRESVPPPSFAFRAGNTALCHAAEESARKTADDILLDLGAMQSRMSSKKMPAPFSMLLSLLFDFCKDHPNVTVRRTVCRDVCIASCMHNLLFVIGMAIQYTSVRSLPLELISGEDANGPMILLRTERSALTPEEAAAHLGFSSYRLATLKRIAEASDFTFEIIPADQSAICFRIPIYTPDTYRIFALDDPTLHAAFMLPTQYFLF